MNTTETNKKLAEFLEWEKGRGTNIHKKTFIAPNKGGVYPIEALKFHNDWSWLMLVASKIEQTPQLGNELDNYIVSIVGNRCSVINLYGEIKSFDGQTKIEAVYNACSMFVDWYNGAQKELK